MLENLKKEVIKVARDTEKWGLCLPKNGNFSARDPETGYVVMTPSGAEKDELTPAHIIVCDIEGNIIEKQLETVSPTVEASLHLEAYKRRDDVFGVVHTHSRAASMFAAIGKTVPNLVFDALHYGGKNVLAPYGRPGTPDLVKSVSDSFSEADVILMHKHGVLAVGANIGKAFTKALYIEQVADIAIKAKCYNGFDESTISNEEFEALAYHA